MAMSDQPEEGVTQSENLQVGGSPGKTLKEEELQDVIEISQHTDPEVPKEVTEPVVGTQMPNAEEWASLAQPPQAIPLVVVRQSTNTDPAQSFPEGTVLQGVEADPVPPSQNVADAKLKKQKPRPGFVFVFSLMINQFLFYFENFVICQQFEPVEHVYEILFFLFPFGYLLVALVDTYYCL